MLPATEREKRPVPESPPSSTPADLPAAGSVLAGKYEVERVLGAGGMGVVIAARHVQLGQRVALKFMRGEAAQSADAVERFLREARAAVSLTSEHVARVLDVGTLESGAPYMVMEYLAGVDLAQMLRRDGPLPVERAVDAVMQACEAIAEAHARGIVHRDLKPANLFLTQRADGAALVKVLDFGISKPGSLAQGQQSLTVSGMVMGSPGYMSPEQVRSSKGVDARSDIWSLGVILYELLTGVCPFQGETIGDTFAKITSEPPPPIRNLRPDLADALAQTIGRCLERKLAVRIQNVGELALRLAAFAPPEAAMLAPRIARLSGTPREPRAETLQAPSFPEGAVGSGRPEARGTQTADSWLRSAALPGRPGRSRTIAAVAGGGLLVCGAIATYAAFAHVTAARIAAVALAPSPANSRPDVTVPAVPSVVPQPMRAASPERLAVTASEERVEPQRGTPTPPINAAAAAKRLARRDAGAPAGTTTAVKPVAPTPGPASPSATPSSKPSPDEPELL